MIRRRRLPLLRRTRLSKLGEDVTETLEVVPRQWKVIQTVREKFSCRDCESVSPGAGPVPCDSSGLGRPQPPGDDRVREVRPASAAEPPGRTLRQGRRGAEFVDARRPGRRLRSVLRPIFELLQAHVLAAERLHGDDTAVPVLAKGKTATGRCWIYVRDDRPFGGPAPPAAVFYYSCGRAGDWRWGVPSQHRSHLAAADFLEAGLQNDRRLSA